ncbi:unnamed protein product [Boreogadus saida]
MYVDIVTGKHRRILNASELEESKEADYCTVLGLYMFTGVDDTSTFKGKGKAREKSVNNVLCSIMLKKMIGEDETLTTRSKVDLSRLLTLRRQPGPTYQPCHPPSGHLQESSHNDILVPQAP